MLNLSESDVEDILMASGQAKKKLKNKKDCTPKYWISLTKKAESIIEVWLRDGVPIDSWKHIEKSKSQLKKKYDLNEKYIHDLTPIMAVDGNSLAEISNEIFETQMELDVDGMLQISSFFLLKDMCTKILKFRSDSRQYRIWQ